ncbi:hypothetical protein [Neisseria elongata]|nr:MAG TPA: hypothetical protein [Caudoviricetes sp.]
MQHQHNMTCAADYYDAELIEAERLKFEAWIEGRGDGEWLKSGADCAVPRDYKCVATQSAWEAWLARAA